MQYLQPTAHENVLFLLFIYLSICCHCMKVLVLQETMRNDRLSIINERIRMRVSAHDPFKLLYPQSPGGSEEDQENVFDYLKRGSQLHLLYNVK
jgi:hypothetical protein